MTTSNLRIIAAGIAVSFAVLTGILTGVVGATEVCTPVGGTGQAPNQDQGEQGTGRRGGDGQQTGAPDQDPDGGQDPTQPGPGEDDPTQPGPGGGLPGDPEGEGGSLGERGELAPLVVDEVCAGGGFSVPAAMIGFLGALIAGGGVTALLFVRRRDEPIVAGAPVTTAETPSAPRDGRAEGDRSVLVQNCIYVRDRVTSKALADRLGWALQEVGVRAVSPTGVRFDPAHHEAGGSSMTHDPAKIGTIAAVEVPGYMDRGTVLRAPVVTVYRQDGQ